MKFLSFIKSNPSVIMITLLILVSGSISMIGDISAQTRGKALPEPDWSTLTAPAQLINGTDVENATTTPSTESESADDELSPSPQSVAPITKTCSATSNPCYGTDGDDNMEGDDGPNLMYGKLGDDQMNGKTANDEIYGEGGNDKIWGLGGDDTMIGGDGDDYMAASYGNDDVNGGDGNNIIEGSYGNDNIYGGSGVDKVQGGPGSDRIISAWGDDIIWHGSGGQPGDPDGSRDIIDCGPGVDEVWINKASDGDEAYECETVNGKSLTG